MIRALSKRPYQLRHGFTLLELMVVTAIIAILVSVGSVAFLSQRGAAKEDRARADLQVIQQGLEAYKARFGDYPKIPDIYPDPKITTEEEYLLNALCGQIGPIGEVISGAGIPAMLNTSLLTYAKPGLPLSDLQKNSIVDPWGTDYDYDYRPDDGSWKIFGYELRSAGPDKSLDTEEDNIEAQ